jgi:hypothetical protein
MSRYSVAKEDVKSEYILGSWNFHLQEGFLTRISLS